MSPSPSELARTYPASSIRRINALADQLPSAVRLTLGEPDIATPEWISQQATAALATGDTHYPPNAGTGQLRDAVARRCRRMYPQAAVEPQNVMIGVGGMGALLLSLLVTVGPGDEVIVPDPGFPNYMGQLAIVGATPVPVTVNRSTLRVEPEQVIDAITASTRAIILNSPSNPLGTILPAEAMQTVVTEAAERDLWVISDEVYDTLTFHDGPFPSALSATARDNVLVVNSLSKTYAMTGWRIGYTIGPANVIERMPALQEGLVSGVPPFLQQAGAAALDHGDEFVRSMRTEYRWRRDFVAECLAGIKGVKAERTQGAFYSFADISELGLSSEEFSLKLLREEAVAVVPGTAFGPAGEGYIRLSFASSREDLAQGLERLARFCESL